MAEQPVAVKATPPCKCTGGPCYWKPEITKVPGFKDMEFYHSHKGPRVRFKGYDDYTQGLERTLIMALINQSPAFDALLDAVKRFRREGHAHSCECPVCKQADAALALVKKLKGER